MSNEDKTGSAPRPRPTGGHFRVLTFAAALIAFLVYLPVLNNGFVNWDDDLFIYKNPNIRTLDIPFFKWAFTSFYAGFLIPVDWISWALDYRLAGLKPWFFHLENALIHSLNTALVFLLGYKIFSLIQKSGPTTKEPAKENQILFSSFIAALLFGLHPLQVESVAWAAERKGLLCGMFFLLSLSTYLTYAAGSRHKRSWYWVSLLFFILALLSKPMAISLPLVLLLLDFWPLERFKVKTPEILVEKIPFLIIALGEALSIVVFQYQTGQTIGLDLLPISFRITNSFHSLVFYLSKMLLPFNLTTFYPIFLKNTYSAEHILAVFLTLAITLVCFYYRKKSPFLLMAWAYYVITLFPVLGLFKANSEAAADRYAYLPCLAPFLLLAGVSANFWTGKKTFLIFISSVWIALLGYGTLRQIPSWKNSIALWENVLRVNPRNNPIVYTNMGFSYQEAGRWDEALNEYDKAIAIGVPLSNPHYGKGNIYYQKGLLREAVQEYKTAIELDPAEPGPHSDLAMAYEKLGLTKEALSEISIAVERSPGYAPAYFNLGIILENRRRRDDAVIAFQKALKLDPDNADYFGKLAGTAQSK